MALNSLNNKGLYNHTMSNILTAFIDVHSSVFVSRRRTSCSFRTKKGCHQIYVTKKALPASHNWIMLTNLSSSKEQVPDIGRRIFLNYLVLGSASLPVLIMLSNYAYFFYPPSHGGGNASTIAKNVDGNPIKKHEFLKTKKPGTRELTQGPKGDPTYLMVSEEGELIPYGLNSVCTHLGCIVPWYAGQNKFICPCHGSQYDSTGKVVRGPAPLPLALSHVEEDEDGNVVFKDWKEVDFRTGKAPWWKS